MVLKGINRLMMATMYFGREGTVKGSWLLNERQSDQKLSEEKKKWKEGWAKRLLETGPTEGDKGLSKKRRWRLAIAWIRRPGSYRRRPDGLKRKPYSGACNRRALSQCHKGSSVAVVVSLKLACGVAQGKTRYLALLLCWVSLSLPRIIEKNHWFFFCLLRDECTNLEWNLVFVQNQRNPCTLFPSFFLSSL
jgi:hypothetical protein